MRHTLAQIDDRDIEASSIAKSVNVLTASFFIKHAWEDVTYETIKNRFRHCGALPRSSDSTSTEEDPFADLDQNSASSEDIASLNELVHSINPGVSAQEYLDVDCDLSTCLTFEGEQEGEWRSVSRSTVLSDEVPSSKRQACDPEDSDDTDDDVAPQLAVLPLLTQLSHYPMIYYCSCLKREKTKQLKLFRE